MSGKYDYLLPDQTTQSPTETAVGKYDYMMEKTPDMMERKEAPSIKEQIHNVPGLVATKGGASLYSLPSSTAEMWRSIGSWASEKGKEQMLERGEEPSPESEKMTEHIVNAIPDFIKMLGEKFPKIFPTYKEAEEKMYEQYKKSSGEELPKEGRGRIEKAAIGVGKAAPLLISPISGPVLAAGVGTSALTEASDLSEKGKIIGNLTIPALTSVIESLITRRYIPAAGEAGMLYQQGRDLGMTANELAPILATEGQVARHGRAAAGLRSTRQAFEQTHHVLGNVIQEMENRPNAQMALPRAAERNLITQLQNIQNDIRSSTHRLSPREENLANFIRDTIVDIQNGGSNPRQLIGTWRSVNQIDSGRTELRRILPPITEAIESVDPQIANDLIATNRMYARYRANLREVNPTAFNAFLDAGEMQKLLGAVFSGDPRTLARVGLDYATLGALRKVSSSILTNANAQSLVRNFGQAVRDGHRASAVALAYQLKNYVDKNLPEESENIKWDDFDIKD